MAAVGARALSVGVADLGGRAFLICCTVAGNVVVEMADTTQLTLPIPGAGIYEFNWSVIEVISSGTTATATYYNLY
jgi:hypothetical protein